MFNFITSAISTIFGGSGATSKAAEFAMDSAKGIGNWIDEQQLTDQESAEFKLKTGQMMLEAVKATQNENSVRSVTRRYLAWAITLYMAVWASVAMICVMLGMNNMVLDMLMVIQKFYFGEAFAGVIGFYFLASLTRK